MAAADAQRRRVEGGGVLGRRGRNTFNAREQRQTCIGEEGTSLWFHHDVVTLTAHVGEPTAVAAAAAVKVQLG